MSIEKDTEDDGGEIPWDVMLDMDNSEEPDYLDHAPDLDEPDPDDPAHDDNHDGQATTGNGSELPSCCWLP
jgi:hypothetical protein